MASNVVREVLNHALAALEPLGDPYALMGGAALAAWHHPRATRDVDLLIGIENADFDRVAARLTASGFRPKSSSPLKNLGVLQFAQFLYTPPGEFYDAQFDLWLADTELQRTAIERRVRRDLPGVERPIYVLNCDDLILFKLLAGRIIDRADSAILLRENRDAIDFEYFLSWVARLDLEHTFDEIWHEAFPGKNPPAS
jgi:predicted nucleotidyltransferase